MWKAKGKLAVEAQSKTTNQDRREKEQFEAGEEPESNMGEVLQKSAELRTDQSVINLVNY